MLSYILNAKVCDASKDDSSTCVWPKECLIKLQAAI